jgi:membrane protein YdbS with pleckstrin-like domain
MTLHPTRGAAASASATALPAAAAGTAVADGRVLGNLPVTMQPHGNLLKYYLLTALLFGPGFIIAVFPLYMRFRTLRYEVDAEGITMRWGVLFRREVSLTYARIQDIQLSSNVVERWLGLARVQLQTASGSASAEMTIEGIRDVDAMRDFLYSRMRGVADGAAGARQTQASSAATSAAPAIAMSADATGELARLAVTLQAVADEVRALRERIAGGSDGGRHG